MDVIHEHLPTEGGLQLSIQISMSHRTRKTTGITHIFPLNVSKSYTCRIMSDDGLGYGNWEILRL